MWRSVLVLVLILIMSSGTNLFSQELSQQVLVPVAGVSSTASINFHKLSERLPLRSLAARNILSPRDFNSPE